MTNIYALSGIRTHSLSVHAVKAYTSELVATGTSKWAYFSSSRCYMSMEPRWNDILGKTEKLGRETCPNAMSTKNCTWTDPGMNLGLCGERLVTNYLSRGMFIIIIIKD
jgi:hypothetical protein